MDETRETTKLSRQAEPFLNTRLYVPRPRPNRIPHSRLLQQLDEGLREESACSVTGIGSSPLAGHRFRLSGDRGRSG